MPSSPAFVGEGKKLSSPIGNSPSRLEEQDVKKSSETSDGYDNPLLKQVGGNNGQYEFVIPSLLPHNPLSINDLYMKTVIERSFKRLKGASSASSPNIKSTAPYRSGEEKENKKRPSSGSEDKEVKDIVKGAKKISSSTPYLDQARSNQQFNPAEHIILNHSSDLLNDPNEESFVQLNVLKNIKSKQDLNIVESSHRHLSTDHYKKIEQALKNKNATNNDYRRQLPKSNLKQDIYSELTVKTKFTPDDYFKNVEHVLLRGRNRSVMVTHGNSTNLFNKGEPVEDFNNKYLLFQKDLIEQTEDFTGMEQTWKQITKRMKQHGSPHKKQEGSSNQDQPKEEDKEQEEKQSTFLPTPESEKKNIWERKKKKRWKPISQFINEQVNSATPQAPKVLLSPRNNLNPPDISTTFITEVQGNNNEQKRLLSASNHNLLSTSRGRKLSVKGNPVNQSLNNSGNNLNNNSVNSSSSSGNIKNPPLSARSVVSSSITTTAGFDLYIQDEQTDFGERNKGAKKALLDTVKRNYAVAIAQSGGTLGNFSPYVTQGLANQYSKVVYNSELTKFPFEELQISDERLKRTKVRGESGNAYKQLRYENGKTLANEEDYKGEDLEKVFAPFKLFSLHNGSFNHSIGNVKNSTDSISITGGSIAHLDHFLENLKNKVQYKNITSFSGNDAYIKNQLEDEEKEQILDDKIYQHDNDFRAIINSIRELGNNDKLGINEKGKDSHINRAITNQTVNSMGSIKKPMVDITINGETFYKSKDTSPRNVEKGKKKGSNKKKVKTRNMNSDVWRSNFVSTQTKLQYELLITLDERHDNRTVVYGSNEHLRNVTNKALSDAEKYALFRVNAGGNKKSNSLWDRSRKKLEIQNERFYQAVLFYKRLTLFLDFIQAPSSSNKQLIKMLNIVRSKLIKNPTLKLTKDTMFFYALGKIVEDCTKEHQKHETDEKDSSKEEEDTPLDLFFSNKENLKVLQFFVSELNITSEDLFTNYLQKIPIKTTKLLHEMKKKMKEKEEQKQKEIKN